MMWDYEDNFQEFRLSWPTLMHSFLWNNNSMLSAEKFISTVEIPLYSNMKRGKKLHLILLFKWLGQPSLHPSCMHIKWPIPAQLIHSPPPPPLVFSSWPAASNDETSFPFCLESRIDRWSIGICGNLYHLTEVRAGRLRCFFTTDSLGLG
jgi:hypothetical protein